MDRSSLGDHDEPNGGFDSYVNQFYNPGAVQPHFKAANVEGLAANIYGAVGEKSDGVSQGAKSVGGDSELDRSIGGVSSRSASVLRSEEDGNSRQSMRSDPDSVRTGASSLAQGLQGLVMPPSPLQTRQNAWYGPASSPQIEIIDAGRDLSEPENNQPFVGLGDMQSNMAAYHSQHPRDVVPQSRDVPAHPHLHDGNYHPPRQHSTSFCTDSDILSERSGHVSDSGSVASHKAGSTTSTLNNKLAQAFTIEELKSKQSAGERLDVPVVVFDPTVPPPNFPAMTEQPRVAPPATPPSGGPPPATPPRRVAMSPHPDMSPRTPSLHDYPRSSSVNSYSHGRHVPPSPSHSDSTLSLHSGVKLEADIMDDNDAESVCSESTITSSIMDVESRGQSDRNRTSPTAGDQPWFIGRLLDIRKQIYDVLEETGLSSSQQAALMSSLQDGLIRQDGKGYTEEEMWVQLQEQLLKAESGTETSHSAPLAPVSEQSAEDMEVHQYTNIKQHDASHATTISTEHPGRAVSVPASAHLTSVQGTERPGRPTSVPATDRQSIADRISNSARHSAQDPHHSDPTHSYTQSAEHMDSSDNWSTQGENGRPRQFNYKPVEYQAEYPEMKQELDDTSPFKKPYDVTKPQVFSHKHPNYKNQHRRPNDVPREVKMGRMQTHINHLKTDLENNLEGVRDILAGNQEDMEHQTVVLGRRDATQTAWDEMTSFNQDMFRTYGIKQPLLQYLESKGISKLYKLQVQCLEAALTRRNVMMYAQHGTGKTLLYLLALFNQIAKDDLDNLTPPLPSLKPRYDDIHLKKEAFLGLTDVKYAKAMDLSKLTLDAKKLHSDITVAYASTADLRKEQNKQYSAKVFAVIVCTIRDHAVKVEAQVKEVAQFFPGVRVMLALGGTSNVGIYKQQLRHNTPHILVGSAGKIETLNHTAGFLKNVKILIIEEFGRVAGYEFMERDIQKMIGCLGANTQVIATSSECRQQHIERINQYFPGGVIVMQHEYWKIPATNLSHHHLRCKPNCFNDGVLEILKSLPYKKVCIYMRDQEQATDVEQFLQHYGLRAVNVHGNMENQSEIEARKVTMKEVIFERVMSNDVVLTCQKISNTDFDLIIHYHLAPAPLKYQERCRLFSQPDKAVKSVVLVASEFRARKMYQICRRLAINMTELIFGSDAELTEHM